MLPTNGYYSKIKRFLLEAICRGLNFVSQIYSAFLLALKQWADTENVSFNINHHHDESAIIRCYLCLINFSDTKSGIWVA